MRPPRGTAASLRISALLLGCAIALPAHAQSVTASLHGASPDALGLAAPDLPADLDLDLHGGTASSRPAADPGAVLKAYAPLRPSADPADRPVATPRPAPKVAAVQAALPPSLPAAPPVAPTPAVPRSPAVAAPRAPADISASIDRPLQQAKHGEGEALVPAGTLSLAPDASIPTGSLPAPPPAVGTLPPPAAAAPPAAPPSPPTPDASAAAGLDATTLQKAVEAFVGTEPVPVAGRINAADLAGFRQRQQIAAFYAGRSNAPLWIEDGRFDARARAVLSRIDHAAEDGLDLKGLPVPVPRGAGDAAALADAELKLTLAAVAYGRQASGGRVEDPSRLAPLIAAKPDVADAARVLGALAGATDAGEALHAFNPPQKGYAALRDKLAELRQKSDMTAHGKIPYGPILKLGMRDNRVPLIRARFGLDLPSAEAGEGTGLVYDTQVAAAVADFQRAHHLPASGILTIRTIGALSGGDPRRLEGEIVANMERWRWLPRDMGENHLDVNIPDYSLSLMHGDTEVHHARVVVGQPDKPTPVFSQVMQFIIVNPYWNVPLSIVKREMMPKLAADPNYFANHGYETVERDGVTYVRQPPGDSNALGRIKFMFPNQYSVYLHDTNARGLFGSERRALSHGCVRVEAPFKLAEAVLGRDHGWSEARVKKMIGGAERTVMLPVPLPIHIVYFTAFVDQTGELKLRDDVYGYSAKLKAVLGLAG